MNIHRSAFYGNLEEVSKILQSFPEQVHQEIELRDKKGVHRLTPIFLAAVQGHNKIVQLLLDYEAKIEWPGQTDSLIEWIEFGYSNTRHTILSIVKKAKNISDMAKLDIEHDDFIAVCLRIDQLLISVGFKIARFSGWDYYVFLGERGCLDRIQKVLDLPELDRKIQEALFYGAVYADRTEVLQLIVESTSFDLESVFEHGVHRHLTPIYVAALEGKVEVLRFLVDEGMNLHATLSKDPFIGMTPAIAAVSKNRLDVLKYLFEKGVNLLEPLKEGLMMGFTPAFMAASEGHLDILRFLHVECGLNLKTTVQEGEGLGLSLAYAAAKSGHVPILEYLYQHDVDLSSPLELGTAAGSTPAFAATIKQHLDVLKFLHRAKVDFSLKIHDEDGSIKSLAFAAAAAGSINELKFFHSIGLNLFDSVSGGDLKGFTTVFMATARGDVEMLKFLKSIGADLSAKILEGASIGSSPVFIAVIRGLVPVLQYFEEEGVDLLPSSDFGVHKEQNPLLIAAYNQRKEVLEFYKSHALFSKYYPKGIDRSRKEIAEASYRAIKPLSLQETAQILCQKIDERPSWFRNYKEIFFKYMNELPISVWSSTGNWTQLKKIFDIYIELKGERKNWLIDVALDRLNQSHEDFDIEVIFSSITTQSIEDIKTAVVPGNPLIKLLQHVSQSEELIQAFKVNDLERWIQGVLKHSSKDLEFWSTAKNFFLKIHGELKGHISKNKPHRRGKGKAKAVKDPFSALWEKLDLKIQDAVTPKEELDQILERGVQELEERFSQMSQQADPCIESWIGKIKCTYPPVEEVERVIQTFNEKILELFIQRASQLNSLVQRLQNQRSFLAHIQQMSKLEEKILEMMNEIDEKTLECNRQFLSQVNLVKEESESHLEEIKFKIDFCEKQRLLSNQMVQDFNLEWKQVKKSLKGNRKRFLQEFLEKLNQADSLEKIQVIREQYQKKLQDLRKMELDFTSVKESTRTQQNLEYLTERNEALKKESTSLRKQVDALEKKLSGRPRSPDKIIPMIEKSTQQLLIEKLSKFSDFSPECKKALEMIHVEGKILSTTDAMVKFLGFFKIEWINTTGSHRQYSDGSVHVTIANHTGDSKPEEIEHVLSAVLHKLA